MKELKERAQAIIDRYSPELATRGLKITLSKRYLETEVSNRPYGAGAIFDSFARIRDHKDEKEKGYHYVRNRYHYFVLTVCPTEKNALRREDCREYVFTLKKIVRAHIGLEPRQVNYNEDKVLRKIEKRILKILKKSEYASSKGLCKNNILDALRYLVHQKYEYKDRFLGKDRFWWEMIFLVAFCILLFGCIFTAWLISK